MILNFKIHPIVILLVVLLCILFTGYLGVCNLSRKKEKGENNNGEN